ncbi:MAG: hypothetical protein ACRD6W_03280, partial [Nitrososphaerales archaeon]
ACSAQQGPGSKLPQESRCKAVRRASSDKTRNQKVTTPQDILREVQAAKIVATGAILRATSSGKLHGWTQIEIAGQKVKFSEDRNSRTIKKRCLMTIDPSLNLNHGRSKTVRESLDELVNRIKTTAHDTATKKQQVDGPKIAEQIQKKLADRRQREKRVAYKNGVSRLKELFKGPLTGMEEDELLEIFRLDRGAHIMES